MSEPNERPNEGPNGSGFNERPNDQGGYHRTLHDRNSDNHISWDTNKDGDYRKGTGHEDRNGHVINQWDR